MWIRRKFHQLQLGWVRKYYPDEHQNKKRIEIAKLLQTKDFSNYSIARACVYNLEVTFSHLEIYINKLKILNLWIENDTVISNSWYSYNFEVVTLERFLCDSKQRYADPVKALTLFSIEYLQYCKNILKIEDQKIGAQGHNYRILKGFSNHLDSLVESLLNFN